MTIPNLLLDPASAARQLADITSFYVSGEDALESNAFNTAAGVTIAIVGRMLLLTGEIVPFAYSHTPNTAGTRDQKRFQLSEGWILNASVAPSAGTPTGSTCVVVVRVVRGVTSNAQQLGVLCQGPITASQELSWPVTIAAGNGSQSIAMPGTVRSITGTNPAPGVEISETVSAGKVWRLISFTCAIVTSATVANRRTRFTVDDGATIVYQVDTNKDVTASGADAFYFATGLYLDANNGNDRIAGVPVGLLLGAGFRMRTVTSGLQAADDYAAPQYLVEEWTP